MNLRAMSWHPGRVFALFLLLVFAATGADLKPIRLRSGTVVAPSRAATAASLQSQAATSGLFLLQLRGPPGAEARAQLEAEGVDLLHYVPQDAFVARFRNARADRVRALPFVRWVGDYRPEHKLHRALQAQTRSLAAGQLLDVSVLVAPRASGAEIAEAQGAFAALRQKSTLRAGTILRGQVTPAQLTALSRKDSVLWLEPGPKFKLVDQVASEIVAGEGGTHTLLTQSLGYDGQGVKVAVADSGLNNGDPATMHPDLLGRTPAFFHYGALADAADEHSHGTHVAGIIAGNGATGETDENDKLYGLGLAPGASIIAQRIFDADGNFEAPTNGFAELTQDATGAGAVIGSNSWGDDTQGQYDTSAMEFDELVRDATGSGTNSNRPYILEFSAGNAGPGPQTMDSPAVAKNVIATGACENDRLDFLIYADGSDAMADFSSRGPCEDGRIKPDVVAPGTWISSLQSESASDQYAWLAIDSLYQYQGGTSQAGPHASGAAAVFVQYYRQAHTNATPSPALVKAALINSATDLADSFGTAPVPNMDEGWGRVDLTPFVDSPLTFLFVDQTTPLTNSQVFEQRVLISDSSEALKITLAYTDVPGFPGTLPALVNDLDLEVVSPDGHLYRGNQFNGSASIPDAAVSDSLNNVEGVALATPVAGEYVVRVRASRVVQDILGRAGAPRQDFALVLSGLFPAPGVGTVHLDRGSYTAPSQIKITVVDTDQAGNPSETVKAYSQTEPLGESVLLTASGPGGSFTGAVATATGPPIPNDGHLQITNNDVIQVVYFDVSLGSNRVATARADLAPPNLSDPTAAVNFGQEMISWTCSEPATSVVRYGTNPVLANLTLAVTNSVLSASNSVTLNNLAPGSTYYYYIASTDEAGNTGTNTHGGAFFSFIAPIAPPFLLVDEYGTDPFSDSAPPLSGYTDPLNAVGVSFDVWDVATLGRPNTNTLRPYRAVLWRVPDLDSTAVWTAAEMSAISNYLYGGGSLFVASMEVLSRLEEVNATAFAHNVLHIQSYVVDPDSTGAAEIIGSPNETVGHGIDVSMDYTIYTNQWSFGDILLIDPPDISDTITPAADATAVLRNDFGDVVGLRWPAVGQQAPGRLVFFTFPLDAVPMGAGVNDRVALVRNVLSFLAPGAPGLSSLALDSSAYSLPGIVGVEVGDANRAGQGTLTVSASSTTQTSAVSVTLHETPTRGDFIGSFQVISATNPPAAGKVRAQNGGTLHVTYSNITANIHLSADAAIDTIAPSISGVSADPDYEQAVVSWNTSEASDSLVQFGESPLLGRTAYDPNLTVFHEVTLSGLAADRTYYYQVMSSDAAGNTTTKDNQGYPFTFATLVPLFPPWSETMEDGATNWGVYSDPDSQCSWTLGTPNNSQETTAHSTNDAWASNLNGAPIDAASTFLISPATLLPAGSTVTLRFWHSYDFFVDPDVFDIYEYGDLLLITNNNSTAAITLHEYADDTTPGWEEQTFDLTPYAGRLIYLAWDYEMFSFDTRGRAGWMVDDVSITVSNPPVGTLVLSNNLWQAATFLAGPMITRTNHGLFTVLPNIPVGQYTLTFSNVPYYVTPASQTNTLAPGATVFFSGNYTFPDVNTNGISDLWEQYFFGSISSNRTRLTDTDGDHMSDYAEFIAGTDPNKPPVPFQVTVSRRTNATCRLTWPSYPAQQYLVLTSSNLVTWTPYTTNWLTTNVYDVPLGSAQRAFFRIQASSSLPPNLSLSIQRLVNHSLRLIWPASLSRGYCVEGSSNGLTWTNLSGWFQATNPTINYSLPAPSSGAPYLFRVGVRP